MDSEIKRAKVKALSLLESMDRTEMQLRLKLKQKAFSDEAIVISGAFSLNVFLSLMQSTATKAI